MEVSLNERLAREIYSVPLHHGEEEIHDSVTRGAQRLGIRE
jgi:hypothetical protein